MPLRSGDGRRAADTAVRMPDFCSPRRGVRQTVDAALASLEQLGVEADRVVLRAAGAGWVTGTVVGQVPAAGVQWDRSRALRCSASARFRRDSCS